MRGQFFKLLQEHNFISETVANGSAYSVNRNSGNIAVVRAVLTSGLYPNVAQLQLPKWEALKACAS